MESVFFRLIRSISVTALICLLIPTGDAVPDDFLDNFIEGSDVSVNFRYRFEYVDEDGFEEDAKASTLRTRLTFKTAEYADFSLLFEADNVAEIGNDQFNNTRNGKGTDNAGNPRYPAVIDPNGTDLNQIYFDYTGLSNSRLRLGRQRINLNNQRFIGGVGWRQNEQTYDGVSVHNTSLSGTELFYSYVSKVNRIHGPSGGTPSARLDSNAHLAHGVFSGWKPLTVSGYAYFLDIEDDDSFSNNTFGARGFGKWSDGDKWSIHYAGEFAYQEDAADNPSDYDANYYLAEGGVGYGDFSLFLGYEVLEGDSAPGKAFRTPLATLHKFQGYADKFLTTPDGGIEDRYIRLNARFGGFSAHVVYHDFEAETGSSDYGDEWDAVITRSFGGRYSAMLKYATYDADDFAADTDKYWLMLSATFD